MKRIIFLIIFVLIVFMACAKTGVPARGVNTPTNENFDVKFLFEIEGIKIYRFFDAGYWRYFSIGNGSYLPSMHILSNGKSTTYYFDGVEN